MQKINYKEVFAGFVGREEALRKVIRYHIYHPMYYRSNLFTHSKRVLWLLQSVLPLAEEAFGSSFDSTKAQLMAVAHDDHEIIMGDIQAGHKEKMTALQLTEMARLEREAIEKMAERSPISILGYNYRDLMIEGQESCAPEAKLMKYVDRFDAFGEALHEVHAGNRAFTTPSVHSELGAIDLPLVFYPKWLPLFPKNNPEFAALFAKSHPLFTVHANFDMQTVVNRGAPHTKDSILKDSMYAPYNAWEKVIIESDDKEEVENLYCQKEFFD